MYEHDAYMRPEDSYYGAVTPNMWPVEHMIHVLDHVIILVSNPSIITWVLYAKE
jgi:hypothetical protein